eukprot:9287463-Pyramimonas_sp.AAC.1
MGWMCDGRSQEASALRFKAVVHYYSIFDVPCHASQQCRYTFANAPMRCTASLSRSNSTSTSAGTSVQTKKAAWEEWRSGGRA